MVNDHIKSIGFYKGLMPTIDLALGYVASVTLDVEIGALPPDLGVKAVVSEYETRLMNELGYDSYRWYIDILLAIIDTEMMRCEPLAQVTETIPYEDVADAARYADCPGIDMVIGNGLVLLVFPEDAHELGLAPGGMCGHMKKEVMTVPVGQ